MEYSGRGRVCAGVGAVGALRVAIVGAGAVGGTKQQQGVAEAAARP